MDDRLILYYRERRELRQEYKDLAAKSCYSMIVVGIALVALRPLMVDQILGRADAYSAIGRLDESKRQCDKALLIDDDNSHAWCQLARIYKIQDDSEGAYAAYAKAVQADNSNRSAQFELGMMYADDGKYTLAIPCFEQVRRLGMEKTKAGQAGQDSHHKAALHMLVRCYEKMGDPVKTELTLKEIRVFYPDFKSEAKPHTLSTPNSLAH